MHAPSPPHGSRRHLGWLLILGLGSATVYAAALLRFPLLEHYQLRMQNLYNLTEADPLTGVVMAAATLLLFVSYGFGAVALRAAPPRSRLTVGLIVGLPLLCILALLLTQPVTSIDLYDYLFRGRMLARYQANTFVMVPQDFSNDPLFTYVAWRRAVTAYGPLWERMSWLVARLAGESPGPSPTDAVVLLRLLLAYKLLAVLGFLLCGGAIWLALGRIAPELRSFGLYLWLWNPLALWESAGAGHNDAWMALLIVLAVWAVAPLLSGASQPDAAVSRGLQGLLALTVGGLIKYLALFFSPLMLAAALRRMPSRGARLALVPLAGLLCGLFVLAAYAQFWNGPDTFSNIGARGALFTASWLAALQPFLVGMPGLAGPIEKELSQSIATTVGLVLLAAGVLWASWRSWRAPGALAGHMLALLLWFLFVCNPWFQPWYLLWALALVALQPWRGRALVLVGLFCATAMLSYTAVTFLRPALGWDDSGAAWNALLSLIIYGPPLLGLVWPVVRHTDGDGRGMPSRGGAEGRSPSAQPLISPMVDQ